MSANLLVVDDDEPVRRLEGRILEESGYRCTLVCDVAQARESVEREEFELALIDINMPGVSGLDLLRYISSEHHDTAAVMVTAVDDPNVAKVACEYGAYGYLIKPFEPNELLITVANALRRRELEAENRMHRERLEQTVLERTASLHQALERLQQAEQDIRLSQEETVLRLARASEQRDDDTGHHIRRMSLYCALLARRLGWSQERCEMTRLASVMHDVGKIGIPDHILGKPGALTPHEFNMMKQHVDLGYRILVGSKSELLQLAASIAWTHHEKYDGSGYVRGLAGEAIPIEGRIAAIADVFDALTSKRVYRPAFSVQKAVSIMQEGRGKHFDPALLDLFLTPLDGVLAIKHEFDDPPP